jgi:hypothetical protein
VSNANRALVFGSFGPQTIPCLFPTCVKIKATPASRDEHGRKATLHRDTAKRSCSGRDPRLAAFGSPQAVISNKLAYRPLVTFQPKIERG